MIVQCPDCSSRFRLADDKLKSEGTKVRCSRCQKVFTVMPNHDSQPNGDGVSESWNETDGPGDAGFHEFDFGDSPGRGELSGEFDANDDFNAGADFDFDAFGSDQEPESDDFFNHSGEGTHDFAFGEPASFEDGSEFSMGEDGEEDFFSSSARVPAEKSPAGDTGVFFDSASAIPADAGPLELQESGSDDLGGFDEDLFGSVDSGEDNLGILPPPAGGSVSHKSGHKGAWLLGLLFLMVLVAGGYFTWKRGTVDLSGLLDVARIRTLLHLDATEIADGQIRTRALNGFFLQSRKAGRLFVIQGEAVNDYREPRSAIAVKGVIFDDKGAPLLQQTVFCGNPLDTAELTGLSFEQIVERMNNQFGDSLSNLNVPAGKAIPFTIVFHNLPAELSEFSVEVVDSKSASR